MDGSWQQESPFRGFTYGLKRSSNWLSKPGNYQQTAISGPPVFCRALRRAGLSRRINADLVPSPALVLELHHAIDQGVNGEVAAEADVAAGMPFGPALADDDVAGDDFLTAEFLDATVLRIAIASVAR